jgi:hypothetical protein
MLCYRTQHKALELDAFLAQNTVIFKDRIVGPLSVRSYMGKSFTMTYYENNELYENM